MGSAVCQLAVGLLHASAGIFNMQADGVLRANSRGYKLARPSSA